MEQNARILVTGASGLVGGALVGHLRSAGFRQVIGVASRDYDLTDRAAAHSCFKDVRPDYVFHTAAYVRGIMGNIRNQAVAFLQNTLINTHVVEASAAANVRKITVTGTVAMYPDPLPSNPLRESSIWAGEPHSSERGYAHAKRGMLAQLEACQESFGMKYACALCTNLYGPGDQFDIEHGHVLPSLVRKFYEARQSGGDVTIWGDGTSLRDFLYVQDAVRGLLLIMDRLEGPVNLATGKIHTIREAADILAAHTGMAARVFWDTSKPSGQAYRAYDVSKLEEAGFSCRTSLEDGLQSTFDWYAGHVATARRSY